MLKIRNMGIIKNLMKMERKFPLENTVMIYRMAIGYGGKIELKLEN